MRIATAFGLLRPAAATKCLNNLVGVDRVLLEQVGITVLGDLVQAGIGNHDHLLGVVAERQLHIDTCKPVKNMIKFECFVKE